MQSLIRDPLRRTLVHPAMTQRLMNNIGRVRCDFPSMEIPERLTWREIQILRLVARGYNNREVSEALAIAEDTVKNYISGILWKLGVRDRTRAVLKALLFVASAREFRRHLSVSSWVLA
jgi:DNA-binding NarL/FixJ family response regulator